jgi:hypothetical protein
MMASEEQIVMTVPPSEEPEGADGAKGTEDLTLGHGARPRYVGWEGSDVRQVEIDWLYKTKRVPPEVSCRLPKGELEPIPEEGEIVVFLAHFACGFGLPASGFFRAFLDKLRLQPHHLPANVFMVLSSFVAFTEGYLDFWPNIELWARLHNLRTQSVQDPSIPAPNKPMVTYGAAMVMPRWSTKFIRMTGLDSCRKWQKTFFYVKNIGGEDLINLPPYVKGTPSKHNWTYNPGNTHA